MNRTIKIIAIVFLVLGALAVIGGTAFGLAGRTMMMGSFPAADRQNMPPLRGGGNGLDRHDRTDGIQPIGRRGFFGNPLWLMGGGITFLIAGAVLLTFNKKISAAVEPVESNAIKTVKEELPAKTKKVSNTRKITKKKLS
jgi:hypothetical protein